MQKRNQVKTVENLNASEVELTGEEFAALEEELSMHRVYGHRGLGGF